MGFVYPPAPIAITHVAGIEDKFPVRRIYCVGRNYTDHAIEMGCTGRELPFFFMKPADAVVAVPEGKLGFIEYPSLTADLQYEIELVVAIGKKGSNITAADASNHIWGYGAGLDMTRRDLQKIMKMQGRPWCVAKAFDQSAPIGPLVPFEITGELREGSITLAVNGVIKQKADLKEMIWSVNQTIEQLSAAWTLEPGDLIFTGTPSGVGTVKRGDVIEGAISGCSMLRVAVR